MNRPSLDSLRPLPLSYYSTRTKAIVAALLAAAIAAATILLWPSSNPAGQQPAGTPGQPGHSANSQPNTHPSSQPSRVPDTVMKQMFTRRQELAANQTKSALAARAATAHTSAYRVLAGLNRKGIHAVTVTDLIRALKIPVSPAFTTVIVATSKAGATLTFTTPIRKNLPGTVLTVFKNGNPSRVTPGK